jgi:hypothetical protein
LAAAFMAAYVLSAGSATAQSVSGNLGNGSVTRGSVAKATVYLDIPGGLHANSNRPGSEYAIPTSVRASGAGVKVGAVSYPRGRNRKFEFSENTINVYEGRVPFTFNVTVPESYRGNSVRLNVVVRYQACTNEVCYPPKNRSITLNARVR